MTLHAIMPKMLASKVVIGLQSRFKKSSVKSFYSLFSAAQLHVYTEKTRKWVCKLLQPCITSPFCR